jgi:hypothetical protein
MEFTLNDKTTLTGFTLTKPVEYFKSKHLNVHLAAYSEPPWLTRLMIKWIFEFEWEDY